MRKHRAPQPNPRTERPGGGNSSSRDESRGLAYRGYRGWPGSERGERRDRNVRGGRSEGSARPARSGRPARTEREPRPFEPPLPAGGTGKELDRDGLDALRGLSRETAERVARPVVA